MSSNDYNKGSTGELDANKESAVPFLPKTLSPSLIIQNEKDISDQKIQQFELDIDPDSDLKKSKSSLNSQKTKEGWKKYLGLIYTLLSTNMFSLNSTIMKTVSHIHPFNVGTFAFPVSALLTIPFILYAIYYQKKSVTTNVLPLSKNKKTIFFMWFRSVMSCVISYLLIYTFKFITVADTRTILASSVISVYFFGWLFLGEKCGVVPILTAFMALIGIGIMTRPPILTGEESFDDDTLIGVGLALCCMLVVTVILIILRFLQGVHHGFQNFCLYTWATGMSIVLGFAFGVFELPQSAYDAGIMCVLGLLLVLGNTFLVLALQNEEAGVVALIRTSEVIFTFFWQMVILGVYPKPTSIVGAILVVTGVVVVTMRKRLASLPENNSTRKRFQFLLR